MNQVRCGGSLGISQVSEARKNICIGSGKAGHGAIGDPLEILGGRSGRGKQWETDMSKGLAMNALGWPWLVRRQQVYGTDHAGSWAPLYGLGSSREWDGSHWCALSRGESESDLGSNRKEMPLISAPETQARHETDWGLLLSYLEFPRWEVQHVSLKYSEAISTPF